MKTFFFLIVTIGSLAATQAQSYIANINVAQEVPTGGGRSGSGVLNLSLSGTTMTVNGSFSGLSANSTLAHIHGPAAVGVNANPVYNFGTLGLITLGGMSGTMSGTFSLAPVGTYTVAQQLSDLNSSLWYFNIHSATFGGGEIRGQITPVPEPSTLGLIGLGVGGFVLSLRQRRNR
jgi:hypothetical protein